MDFQKQIPFSHMMTDDIHKLVLKFTLFLYNNPLIPRSAVQDIITNVSTFISNFFIPFLQCEMRRQLQPMVDVNALGKVQFILEEFKNPFVNLSTEHLRLKVYHNESAFDVPEQFDIGKENVVVNSVPIQKPLSAAHLSLEKTLRVLFELPGVFEETMAHMKSLREEKVIISNIIQGNMWKRKYEPSNGRNVLPIILFYNDFETVKTIGSKVGEQKFGGVYASLPCLPPHLAEKLSNNFVTTIFYANHRTICGNRAVFIKDIEELQRLSDHGIRINVNGAQHDLFFECVLFVGDNLRINSSCGFSDSFDGKHYCRICRATNEKCEKLTVEDKSLLRTRHDYEMDLRNGTGGVKGECVFNRLSKFHITENQSIDIMRDLFEGAANDTISNVLTHFVCVEKTFTLNTLNDRIVKFEYGELEKSNRPRPLTLESCTKPEEVKFGTNAKVKVDQSAAEMLCLSRYLGLMIGDLIPPKSKHWSLYLSLRKIIAIVTAPRFVHSDIIAVNDHIRRYHELYASLYGVLEPLSHFMVHIPRIMEENGPVVHFWGMTAERKHTYLKDAAASTCSSRNLPYTIGIRVQLQLCFIKEFFVRPTSDFTVGPVDQPNARADVKRIVPNIVEPITAKTYKYVEMNGEKFLDGTVFFMDVNSDGEPKFGKVKKLYEIKGHVYIFASTIQNVVFDDEYYAFHVYDNDTPDTLIHIANIPRTDPCLFVKKKNECYVACRYDI